MKFILFVFAIIGDFSSFSLAFQGCSLSFHNSYPHVHVHVGTRNDTALSISNLSKFFFLRRLLLFMIFPAALFLMFNIDKLTYLLFLIVQCFVSSHISRVSIDYKWNILRQGIIDHCILPFISVSGVDSAYRSTVLTCKTEI